MTQKDLQDLGQFTEIRALLESLPVGDQAAAAAARERQGQLTKPPGSLGRLEEIAIWLAEWQGRHPPAVERPYAAIFAGNHGVTAQGVSAYPAEVTQQMVQNFIAGGAAVNQLCGLVDADLRVYEMALEHPTNDFSQEPAMSEEDCVKAMAYGMMAVEDGIDVLALGEMGIGNTTSGAALCKGLFGGAAEDWVGRGTGVDDQGFERKRDVVERSVALHRAALEDPLQVLRCLGGLELAAIAGAVIAARLARTPVLLDGFTCTAAAAVLYKLDPSLLDHCMIAHCSVEPGHTHLMDQLGMRALFDFDMRLGEGSGAVLAIQTLQAACVCHGGMATFAEAGVSGPVP